MADKSIISPSVLDTSFTRRRREQCYHCSVKFISTDTIVTCVIYANRFHGKCVDSGGFTDQDIIRINQRESFFRLVCRFCKPRATLHANNENLIDSKAQNKALEEKHTNDLKILQADVSAAEVAKAAVTRKFVELERRYDDLKLSIPPDNDKYKHAYKAQK